MAKRVMLQHRSLRGDLKETHHLTNAAHTRMVTQRFLLWLSIALLAAVIAYVVYRRVPVPSLIVWAWTYVGHTASIKNSPTDTLAPTPTPAISVPQCAEPLSPPVATEPLQRSPIASDSPPPLEECSCALQ